jgi:cellulose biosynthesis protein BcsQ
LTTPIIAFFNNKGGVGKTSLVYHLSWMFADLGVRTLAADLDPQANLSGACLDEERLENLLSTTGTSIFDAYEPLKRGRGDIKPINVVDIAPNLGLILGDLRVSELEDDLSDSWTKALDGDERAFLVCSAFFRILQDAAKVRGASLILMDLGPNLGAINRAALIAANFIVVPLAPDLFSLQGLQNLGPTLKKWRAAWQSRLQQQHDLDFELPAGLMQPMGYIVLQHAVRLDRPVKAYEKWMVRIPSTYRKYVDETLAAKDNVSLYSDPNRIAQIKNYRSLMPLAQEAHKPMFHLKPADGAMGAHFTAAGDVRNDFEVVARDIARRAGISIAKSPYSSSS